jgi:hypothetical protein
VIPGDDITTPTVAAAGGRKYPRLSGPNLGITCCDEREYRLPDPGARCPPDPRCTIHGQRTADLEPAASGQGGPQPKSRCPPHNGQASTSRWASCRRSAARREGGAAAGDHRRCRAAAPPVLRKLGETGTEVVQRVAKQDERDRERDAGKRVQQAAHQTLRVFARRQQRTAGLSDARVSTSA